MKRIAESELILNPDGSVYHLKLKPENIADTIITVGDQYRVSQVTKHFQSVEFSIQKREFKTETGTYRGKRMTVISTGIGPDNIDIVFNELDALVNINLESRTVKEQFTKLNIIRVGTSGSIQPDIPVDSFVISEFGLGLDSMIYSYNCDHILEKAFNAAFIQHVNWNKRKARPYLVKCSTKLRDQLKSNQTFLGVTATADGFYGPQGRILRLPVHDNNLVHNMADFTFENKRITNFEMETAAIYAMSKLLGHHALSMNVIIANRATGEFSNAPKVAVENLIQYTLNKLTD